MRKAKMLLRLSKSLNRQAGSLHQACARISQTSDRNSAAGLNRMAANTQMLLSDVKDAAYEVICLGRRNTISIT
ncbi:MAG: hypothetical protein P4L46_21645 [Fimbriimonas sp.]|nr:hypothetical protein [Fimbriimonas sp.]